MSNMDVFVLLEKPVMLKLMLLLTRVKVINQRCSWMLKVLCPRILIVGTLSCCKCIINCCCFQRGGDALDRLVWDQYGRKKMLWTNIKINVDLALLIGPLGFLIGP